MILRNITHSRHEQLMMTSWGFLFTNLTVAISYLKKLDPAKLAGGQELPDAQVEAEEAKFAQDQQNTSTNTTPTELQVQPAAPAAPKPQEAAEAEVEDSENEDSQRYEDESSEETKILPCPAALPTEMQAQPNVPDPGSLMQVETHKVAEDEVETESEKVECASEEFENPGS